MALLSVAFGLSIIRPSVLVGVPMVVLLVALPTPRMGALAVGVMAAVLIFTIGQGEG
jgi:hypothetical protein